jgi:hypothetical protein
MILIFVSWVRIPCCLVGGYHHFRGTCCIHLHVNTARLCSVVTQKTTIRYQKTSTRKQNQEITVTVVSMNNFYGALEWLSTTKSRP